MGYFRAFWLIFLDFVLFFFRDLSGEQVQRRERLDLESTVYDTNLRTFSAPTFRQELIIKVF